MSPKATFSQTESEFEQGGTLEQHPELAQHCLARAAADPGDILSVDQYLAFVRTQDAENALDGHGFPGTRAADDDQRVPAVEDQIDAVQHDFRAEAFLDTAKLDFWSSSHLRHFENSTDVRR